MVTPAALNAGTCASIGSANSKNAGTRFMEFSVSLERLWGGQREMERQSREARNLGYIELNTVLFDKACNIRQELFLPDNLRFRPESTYAKFAAVVKPILTKAWENGVGLSAVGSRGR